MSIASEELLGSAPTDALCVVVDLYVKTDAVEQICNRPWMSRIILFYVRRYGGMQKWIFWLPY